MPFYLSAERLAELLTPERLAHLDPPLPDDNYTPVLPPDPLPKRVYHQEGVEELSIQKAMEMEEKLCEFMYLMRLVRDVTKTITDINIPYSQQEAEVLRNIKKEVLNRAPVFYNYEDAWPITAYLRSAMKGHHRSYSSTSMPPSTRSPAPAPTSGRATPHQNLAFVMVPRRRSDSVVSYMTEPGGSAEKVGEYSGDEYEEELGDEPGVDEEKQDIQVPRARPSPHNGALESSRSGSHSTSSATPPPSSSSRTILPSPTPTARSANCQVRSERRASASTRTLSTVSRAASAYSRSRMRRSPRSIHELLTGLALPPADAAHVTRVLAERGITDVAYLRVFGKMASRGAWLAELRAEGSLTESQVRAVRELWEVVAVEDLC